MIRRALAALMALAMLLVAVAPADAKLAVVVSRGLQPPADESSASSDMNNYRDLVAQVRGQLDALGVDYDVITASTGATKTHWLRTGQIVFNAGLPSAYVKSYDAVLHVGANVLGNGTSYRPDSLQNVLSRLVDSSATTVRYNTVPQILVMTNGTTKSGTDSLSTALPDMTDATQLGQTVWSPGNPYPYRPGVAKMTVLSASTSSYVGGFRVLLRTGTGTGKWTNYGSIPRPWPDSLNRNDGATVNSDSAIVWARLYSNIPSAKPMIMVNHADFQSSNTDMAALLVALAYADSTVNGAIFSTAKNVPLKVGIQIRGGFSRGAKLGIPTSTGGMTTTDSVAFKASIDSLASLDVPMVLGCNIDSLSTYSLYDKRWWSNVKMLKYGVYQRAGIDTTAAFKTTLSNGADLIGDGRASFDYPRDIFGMYRNRAAFGDSAVHSVVDNGVDSPIADSSIAQLVRGAFAKLATTFGSNKVDRILMAPGDDWCPKNGTSVTQDSIIYGLTKGGAKGIVVNPYRDRIGVYTGGQGFTQRPGNDPVRYNRSRAPFKLLATPSYLDSGSVRFDNGNMGRYPTIVQTERMWRDMLTTHGYGLYQVASSPVNGAWTADSTRNVRARILTIHCADLGSGTRADASTIPLRPGWFVVKNFVNMIKTINSFTYRGKPLFVIAYPEDCEP